MNRRVSLVVVPFLYQISKVRVINISREYKVCFEVGSLPYLYLAAVGGVINPSSYSFRKFMLYCKRLVGRLMAFLKHTLNFMDKSCSMKHAYAK